MILVQYSCKLVYVDNPRATSSRSARASSSSDRHNFTNSGNDTTDDTTLSEMLLKHGISGGCRCPCGVACGAHRWLTSGVLPLHFSAFRSWAPAELWRSHFQTSVVNTHVFARTGLLSVNPYVAPIPQQVPSSSHAKLTAVNRRSRIAAQSPRVPDCYRPRSGRISCPFRAELRSQTSVSLTPVTWSAAARPADQSLAPRNSHPASLSIQSYPAFSPALALLGRTVANDRPVPRPPDYPAVLFHFPCRSQQPCRPESFVTKHNAMRSC